MKINPVKIADTCINAFNNAGSYATNKCGIITEHFDKMVTNTKFNSLKGKVGGKTVLGAGIILSAMALATKALISIKNEISRIRNK